MAILQKLVSHGGKRLSLYADKGCHLRKMAALLFPEESSTILRLPIKSKEELLIEEANALDSLFMSMKIEDISIEIRDNQLVAFDSDGNKWVENEIFDFALNECLTFGADGHLIDGYCINEELLDQILHYAAQRDVKIERIPL